MSDRLYDGLGAFSRNVLKVWEEEQQNDRRRRKLAAVGIPSHVVKALTSQRRGRQQQHQREAARSLSSMTQWSSTRKTDYDQHQLVAPRSSSSAALIGHDDNEVGDDDDEGQLPSMHQLALVSREEDRPHVLSVEAPQSWSTSFHHLHHEAKKRERIRRLERLRLDREAELSDALAVREEELEAQAQAAAAMKLSGIQKTTRRLHQTLEHLHGDEEVVRKQGFRRVQDTVRHSLLRQCGDTMPVVGECVRLLPLTLVEDAFHHYGLVCPHDLLHWSDSVGHVVEVTPLKYKPTTPVVVANLPPPAGTSNTNAAVNHRQKSSQSSKTGGGSSNAAHGVDDTSQMDYQVVVRFGFASQGSSHVFELFASCLELAADPSLVPAPLVMTDQGILLELTKLSISIEIAGDVAVVTHQSSWVAPRVVQREGAFADVALLCPLDEHIRLTSVSADVGDSKLRSIALDEQDGREFVKKCQQARSFRLQQVMARSDAASDSSSSAAANSKAASHPVFTSTDTDPMLFVNEDVSAALPATGLRALGLWQDNFQVLSQQQQHSAQQQQDNNTLDRSMSPGAARGGSKVQSPAVASSAPAEFGSDLNFGGGGGSAPSPFSTRSANDNPSPLDGGTTSGGGVPVKGTLIPLKQLKVSEQVHLQLQFQISGSHVQRASFQRTSSTHVDSRSNVVGQQHHPSSSSGSAHVHHNHQLERAVDFRFPCCYPDACFNYDARRTFESISSLTVCVIGGDARHVNVHSAPRTVVDESPLLSAAYMKSPNSVIVSQLASSGGWGNHDIRLQVSHAQQQKGILPRTPVDTSSKQQANNTNDDVEAIVFVDSYPALQMDFFAMRIACPTTALPEHIHGEPPLRRLINVLVDLRSSNPVLPPTSAISVGESPGEGGWGGSVANSSQRQHQWVENIHCAILDLIGRLGSEDMVTFSILRDDQWSLLQPHDDAATVAAGAAAAASQNTPGPPSGRLTLGVHHTNNGSLSARSAPNTSRVPHATPRGDQRSHRASTMWWRKSQLNSHDHSTNFFPRWMSFLTDATHHGAHSTNAAPDDPKVTAAWIKAHQHISSLVHSEHGRDDIREAFVFTGTVLSRDAQQQLAIHLQNPSHLTQYRLHVALLRNPPHPSSAFPSSSMAAASRAAQQGGGAAGVLQSPSTADLSPQLMSSPSMFLSSPSLDPLAMSAAPPTGAAMMAGQFISSSRSAASAIALADDLAHGTSLVWLIAARKTKGTIVHVSEGHSSQRVLMGLVTCEHATSDLDVALPSAADFVLLNDARNLPLRGGGVVVMGVASYGGSMAIAGGSRSELNGGSSVSPIENVTITAKFSPTRKCIKRISPVKLPLGALANILATKSLQYEVAAAWVARLVALVGQQQESGGGMNHQQLSPSFRSTSTGGGGVSTTSSMSPASPLHMAQQLDVVECGCFLGVPVRRGPFAVESMASSASTQPPSYSPPLSVQGSVMLSPTYQQPQQSSPVRNLSSPPTTTGATFAGRSTKLFLFHQIIVANAAGGASGQSNGAAGGLRQVSITASAYPPRLLGPPAPLSATLGLGSRSWRDAVRQSCQGQHLEMSVFVPFATSMDDFPPTTSYQAAVPSALNTSTDDSNVAAAAPTAITSKGLQLLGWVIHHNARFHTRVSQLVAEEYAVRGECEFDEWNTFLEIARNFHQHGAAVQLHQLDALRDVTCFAEEERLARGEILRAETKDRQHLTDSTAEERSLLKRCSKHLREARQHVAFQEEDARKVISDDVLHVQEVVRRSLQHSMPGSNHSAHMPLSVVPTSTHAEFMLSAIETFQDEPETVALLCFALITWALVPLHAQLLGHQGAVIRMKTLLQVYARNVRIVELAVRVLHLLSKIPANHCKIEQSGVIGAVLTAMECHSRSEGVQLRCAQFFATTTKVTQGMRLAILKSPTGGVEHILSLLKLWSHNVNISRQTFRVIRNLVMESMAHRFVAEEGVPTMVSVANNAWVGAAAVTLPNAATSSKQPTGPRHGGGHGEKKKQGDDVRTELAILLMKAVRELCADRGARMILAVQGSVTSFVVQIVERYVTALSRRVSSPSHPLREGENEANVEEIEDARLIALPTILEEALQVVLRMTGNVADYPCAHLFGSLVHLLTRLDSLLSSVHSRDEFQAGRGSSGGYEVAVHKSSLQGFGTSGEVLKTILTRFTLITVPWLPECAVYETSMRPWFKPWSALTLLDKQADPSYGAYPHPLACCYGRTIRAMLKLGYQDVPCILRLFTNEDMDRHIAGPGLLPDVDPSEVPPLLDEDHAAIVKEQRRSLFRCAIALQLQDAVENSRTRSPYQLACLGFTSWEDTHATIYAAPPRYTLRMVLMAIFAHGDSAAAMLLSAWLHLAIVLMETLVFLDKLHEQKCVHGNLDLDHIFCEEDLSRECEPKFVIGPAVAIPNDVVDLVPPADTQTLFTREEFSETASRTLLDDDNDARRALLEALYYGQEDDEDDGEEESDGNIMERVMRKLPESLAQAVFGLRSTSVKATTTTTGASHAPPSSQFHSSPYRKSPSELLTFLTTYRDKHVLGTNGPRSSRQKNKRIPLSPLAHIGDMDDNTQPANISQLSAIW
ncbi:Hypothetical protein, putative [Bodo saltans]|uniref:Uncharacterized protein n=1 Tax=Bodo saltans TaxID=75058 RepID=A0A0S4J6Z8_BODSA|nr:Hypothetical protein, putative [Bodo saltans]|eukprot:CUG87247.1 Hypothetical protein, putative [Bodo saltans]